MPTQWDVCISIAASAAEDVRNCHDPPLQAASQGHTVACHLDLDSLHM
ncbi:MAG: hypothetical protein ACJ0TD_02095 [Arenicellales bacterium]